MVASRISRMMIHVAEASGVPPEAMRNPQNLISSPHDLARSDTAIPWQDLTVLAKRVGLHFGNSEAALVDLGRSYYRHLEHLPYTRLASNILTLKGALYFAQRYTTPHNYEALICTSRWQNRNEGVKTNRLKYEADKNSEVICHITRGVLEYFPTLFGREPMTNVEMEIGEREASYHFTLPPPIGTRKFISRAIDSVTRGKKNWEILKEQESCLIRTQWDARRRQSVLDELLSQAPQPLALLENDRPVFLNRALDALLGGEEGAAGIPFSDILTQLQSSPALDRVKFSSSGSDGTAIPLEAILAIKICEESYGSEMFLLRFRDRRIPETREEAVTIAREQERANFSRDLHDGLGQTLSGIAYRIAALRQASPDDLALSELEGGIRSALAQARIIAHNTHRHQGIPLVEMLRLTTTSFAGLTKIPIQLEAEALPDCAVPSSSHDIDMILREVLANAVRHSGANKISVRIAVQENNLKLEISDDGVGFPEDHPNGFGMKSIRARASAANGTVQWSDTNPGTLVRCLFPLSPP